MLTKAKQFFRNPVYLLAVIVSLAVVGVGSVVAVRAYPEGGSSVPEGYEEYTVKRLFYDGEATSAVIKSISATTPSASGLTLSSPYYYQYASGYTMSDGTTSFSSYLSQQTGGNTSDINLMFEPESVPTGNPQVFIWLDGNSYYKGLNGVWIDLQNDVPAMTGHPLAVGDFNESFNYAYICAKLKAANSGAPNLDANVTEDIVSSLGAVNTTGDKSGGKSLDHETYGCLFANAADSQNGTVTYTASWDQSREDEIATIPLTYNGNFSYSAANVKLPVPASDDITAKIYFMNEYGYSVGNETLLYDKFHSGDYGTNMYVCGDSGGKFIDLNKDSGGVWLPVQVIPTTTSSSAGATRPTRLTPATKRSPR